MLLGTLSCIVALAPATWSLQSASGDLTPPEPLPLGGYTRRPERPFEPGGDPLWVRVSVLRQGNRRVAFAAVDLLTVPRSLTDAVRSRIPSDLHLMLGATHTHCAPDSQMLNARMTFKIPGIAVYRSRWLEWYADRIASTITTALQKPERPLHGFELRQSYVMLNRGRRAQAWPDPRVSALYGLTPEGPVPILAVFAAHPTLFDDREMRTRTDWPGELAARLNAPVFSGALGDVSPAVAGDGPIERAQTLGRALHAAIQAAKPRAIAPLPMRWTHRVGELGPIVPHPEFAPSNRIPEALARVVVERFALPTLDTTSVGIGKLAIVGIGGEPTSRLGRRVESRWLAAGYQEVLVLAHINDWAGYLLEPRDYDAGGYEATLSFHGRLAGERVVELAAGRE